MTENKFGLTFAEGENPHIGYSWNTEDRAFECVGEIEWSDEAYQFDMTGVWIHKASGRVFTADDSGCSCPSPWESTNIDDLTEVTRMQDFFDHCADRVSSRYVLASAVDEYHEIVQTLLAHFKKMRENMPKISDVLITVHYRDLEGLKNLTDSPNLIDDLIVAIDELVKSGDISLAEKIDG